MKKIQSLSTLKPCPFCGMDAQLRQGKDPQWIGSQYVIAGCFHTECGAAPTIKRWYTTIRKSDKAESIAAIVETWNARKA